LKGENRYLSSIPRENALGKHGLGLNSRNTEHIIKENFMKQGIELDLGDKGPGRTPGGEGASISSRAVAVASRVSLVAQASGIGRVSVKPMPG
jgi:hypothetical protein